MDDKTVFPLVEILLDRYEELIQKETQLEFIKNWAKKQSGYTNIADLKILLDVCEEQK